MPEIYSDVFTNPSCVIAFNLDLRKKGWSGSPGWPDSFLAIGQDPGGNVLFFDANTEGGAVWLADHEVSFAAADPSECVDMEKQADSFSAYIAQLWQRYLDDEGELPTGARDRSDEFKILREHAHPLLLENYFEESATRYEAYQSWTRRRGDNELFSAVRNLGAEAAFELLMPASEIATRQQTYGRFRAAIGLLDRLLEASEQTSIPPEAASSAVEILKRAEAFNLDNCHSWTVVKRALIRS